MTLLLAVGPLPGPIAAAAAPPVVLVGAGDIAECGNAGAVQTAALLDAIPGTVFAAGDLAYPTGSASDFADCFDPTWGRFRSRMIAAPGNHEYLTSDAAGFFDDLGAAAGPRGLGYYATDVGAWRIYVLNANCGIVPCDEASAQVAWLRAEPGSGAPGLRRGYLAPTPLQLRFARRRATDEHLLGRALSGRGGAGDQRA